MIAKRLTPAIAILALSVSAYAAITAAELQAQLQSQFEKIRNDAIFLARLGYQPVVLDGSNGRLLFPPRERDSFGCTYPADKESGPRYC
jgi:hypothetical protein